MPPPEVSRVLRGERVHLRAPLGHDRRELLALTRASRSLHRPWVWPPTGPAGFARWRAEGRSPNRERRLVCRNADGAIVGYLGVNEISFGALRSGALGYWVGAPHAGHSYMRQGLELLVDHLFRRRRGRLHRLEANIQPGNEASIALARACGFQLEGFSPRYLQIGGEWLDHERWALTAEHWRAVQLAARFPSGRTGHPSRR